MTTLTESNHAGEHLISEASGTRSRDAVTILSGQTLVAGTVLGRVTASGKYAAHDPAASDGTQAAAAVLYAAVDASAGDVGGTITARDAEVDSASLTWAAGISVPNKSAAIAALAALGIIVR